MSNKKITLIFHYRNTGTYALNVILGALETNKYFNEYIEILIAKRPTEVVKYINESNNLSSIFVFWSFYSTEFRSAIEELYSVKRQSQKEVIHIVGGVHATAEPEATLKAGFNFVATGEGEILINQIVTSLIENSDIRLIHGIGYINENKLYLKGSGERVNLNDFPPFALIHRKYNPIEITRGCIYACKFCQTPFMFKAKFRHRTIENICYYVELMKREGLTDIRFITPTSLSYGSNDESVNLGEVEKLLSSVRNIIGKQGKIFFGTFPSEVRPEHITIESLALLKKYVSNNNIIIGAQSGSQKILDQTHRGHSVEEIIKSVALTIESGFIANIDFIFGLPGEEPADVESSLLLAEKLTNMGAKIHGHTFMPLPGTPYKNSPAGLLSSDTKRRLKTLVSRGKLYGKWQEQEEFAKDLALQALKRKRIAR